MSASRIAGRFAELKGAGRAGLVAFITAGDPDAETSAAILAALPAAGADVIELGMPFSDPMADGPAVQAAGQRALKAGANMHRTLDLVRDFRKTDDATPIVLMGYFNPIYIYGVEKFTADAKAAGVDGLIIVDLPPEEDEMRGPLDAAGLDFIYLAAPTTTDERLRRHTDLPIAVGFGIKTPEQAEAIASSADAVVVGSAIVDRVSANVDDQGAPGPGCVDAVLDLVRGLRAGVEAAAGAKAAGWGAST